MDPAIQIEGLRVRFEAREVLQGIDLVVPAGKVLGYIGPNGAGKTTTIKVLIGMLPRFVGRVRVAGIDVREEPTLVKRRIGYVPETGALYESLTPLEHLTLIGHLHGLPEARTRAKATELFRLLDLPRLHSRMATFSKGMKQKVLLVAGLIHNPEVLFLDEPLSGLDANATLVVKELIAGLARAGRTVFYSSHLMDVVERVSDRIVILNEGRIVADGSFEELRAGLHESSLERIFSQLTSEGEQASVAGQLLRVIQE